jgi:hypothetical protein
LSPRPLIFFSLEDRMSAAGQVAAIGMKQSHNESEVKARFAAVMSAVEQFVGDHPEMLLGDGEFSVVFGNRDKIMSLGKVG